MTTYNDAYLSCDDRGIDIRWYRFPFGTKHIPWSDIASVRKRTMGPLTGQWRIWGSGDFTHWWHLDTDRPAKTTAFALTVRGARMVPMVTPSDVDAFAKALADRGLTCR